MRTVQLSTLDHVFANEAFDPIQLVFHYRAELDVDSLLAAFATTAAEFSGMDAVLRRQDEHTLAFEFNGAGARVSVESATPDALLHALVDPVVAAEGQPVAALRITRLGDQGTAVALSMAHCVADGYGYLLFMSAWAARVRGERFPTPNCDRTLLTPPPGATPSVRELTAVLPNSGFTTDGEVDSRVPLEREERLIPQQVLSEWKERLTGAKVSTNAYLSALLWKEAAQSIEGAETTFTSPIDVRQHRAALGPMFFGNASIVRAAVTLDTSVVREQAPELTAANISAEITQKPSHIDAAIRELDDLRRINGLAVLRRLRSVRPKVGFLVSNLSRLPFDRLNFGEGPPSSIEPASRPPARDRSCAVFPAEGGLRLILARP